MRPEPGTPQREIRALSWLLGTLLQPYQEMIFNTKCLSEAERAARGFGLISSLALFFAQKTLLALMEKVTMSVPSIHNTKTAGTTL